MADTPNVINVVVNVDEKTRQELEEAILRERENAVWQRARNLLRQAEAPGARTVKVGPITYIVGEHDWPPDKEAGSQAMGRTFSSEGKIMLLRSMPPDVKHITLWHEIIHVILDQAGQDASEGVIEALSHGVVATLGDNPWLGDNAYAVFPPNPEPTS